MKSPVSRLSLGVVAAILGSAVALNIVFGAVAQETAYTLTIKDHKYDPVELAIARADRERVVDEIEVRLEDPFLVRDGTRREPSSGDVQGDVGPFGLGGRQGQPKLPDHLGVHVERVLRLPPGLVGNLGPGIARGHAGSIHSSST